MALMINEDCICCGACDSCCPNDAISEGEEIYIIDPDACTECIGFYDEPQCVENCPVDAIVVNPKQKEAVKALHTT